MYLCCAIFFSHQGHLRWLWPWFWCSLRLHWFMEQSVPHPRRLIQCQPADETLQKVNTRTTFLHHLLLWHITERSPLVVKRAANRVVLRSLIREDAFVMTSCSQPQLLILSLLLSEPSFSLAWTVIAVPVIINVNDHASLVWFLLFPRSTEEVIALFISIAFVGDAVKGTVKSKSEQGQSVFSIF